MDTRTTSSDLQGRLAALESGLAEAGTRVHELAAQVESSWPSLLGELVDRSRGSSGHDERLEMEIGFLRHQLSTAEEALKAAREDAGARDGIAALERRLADVNAESTELERRLRERIAALEGELAASRATPPAASEQLAIENAELREQLAALLMRPPIHPGDSVLHAEIATLRSELARERSRPDGAANDSALQREIASLQAQLAAAVAAGTTPSAGRGTKAVADDGSSHRLQQQLLEIEQLRATQANLHRTVEEWRSRARLAERARDELQPRHELLQSKFESELRAAEELRARVKSLEATIHDQKKTITRAAAREEHLRQHIGRSS